MPTISFLTVSTFPPSLPFKFNPHFNPRSAYCGTSDAGLAFFNCTVFCSSENKEVM